MRCLSYGGGQQSTALLVLAASGRLDLDAVLFANVGDDSEHPGTLAYVRDIATPWAAEHGLTVTTLDRHRRDGTVETLLGRLTRPGSRSLPIPVRMSNGAPGTRSCTADFKIRVIGKWLKAHGATAEDPATVAIGISLEEIHRANTRRVEPYERIVYPLLDLGMRRAECATLVAAQPLSTAMAERARATVADQHPDVRRQLVRSGFTRLPVPPKSSCWFCPFHRLTTWAVMRADEPELFEQSCELEDLLNDRRAVLGKDPVYLTRTGRPLRRAVDPGVQLLPFSDDGDGSCDSGWCMT